MKQDRARFTLLNLGSSSVKNVVTTLVGFIATPFIITQIGNTSFGLSKTLITFFGQFSILEFGLYSTTLSLFIKVLGKDDKFKTMILNWGIKKYQRITLLSLGISLFVSIWLYYKFLPNSNHIDLLTSLILCQIFFVVLPFLPYKAYLESNHQTYIVNGLQLMNSLIYTAAAVSLSYFYPSTSGIIAATVVGILISNLMYRQAVPESVRNHVVATPPPFYSKMQYSFFINELSGRLCLMIDDLLISFMMGPKFVVPFFITQRLPQVIQGQLLNIGNSSWSTLGLIYNSEDMKLFNRRLIELTKITAVFGSTSLMVIILYNRPFISLWINSFEYVGNLFTIVVCLNAFILPILTLWGWSFNYSHLVKEITTITWTQTVVNLLISIILTLKFGLIGPVLGTLITYVTVPLLFLSLKMKKHFEISLLKLHLSWTMPLGLGIIFYFALNRFPQLITAPTWPHLLLKMFMVGLIVLIVSVRVFFDASERREYKERIQKLFKRKS